MKRHGNICGIRVLKGTFIASAVTLIAMGVLTLVVWKGDVSDEMLLMINQIIKILSVAWGTWRAVGRGGEKGFICGALIGTCYMAMGYVLYAALGGPVSAGSLLGEWMTGSAAGAFTGAVAANLSSGKRAKA